jgi:hypothetical protein
LPNKRQSELKDEIRTHSADLGRQVVHIGTGMRRHVGRVTHGLLSLQGSDHHPISVRQDLHLLLDGIADNVLKAAKLIGIEAACDT